MVRAQNQSILAFLMNEHDRQIPTRVALPERHVYIFSRALSFFKETELWSIVKHLLDFLLLDAVLESQLINNIS